MLSSANRKFLFLRFSSICGTLAIGIYKIKDGMSKHGKEKRQKVFHVGKHIRLQVELRRGGAEWGSLRGEGPWLFFSHCHQIIQQISIGYSTLCSTNSVAHSLHRHPLLPVHSVSPHWRRFRLDCRSRFSVHTVT